MKNNAHEVRPTPVCLPRPLIAALDAQAKAEQIYSRSAIIRRACGEYLARHTETAPNKKPVTDSSGNG